MGLQLRRGTNAERLQITPLQGELVYTTDTKSVYVGDGQTIGGLAVTAFTTEDAQDAVASLFENGTHSGITFDYIDSTNRINATVTSTLTSLTDVGVVDPQPGQVLKFNGEAWANAADTDTNTGILSIEEDINPALGGNLNLNSFNINGTGDINISGVATVTELTTNTISSTGSFVTISSEQKPAMRIKGISDGTLVGLPFLEIYVSKGTLAAPTNTVAGDQLSGIKFTANNNSTAKFAGSISAQWDDNATMSNSFPGSVVTISAGNNSNGYNSASFTGTTGVFSAPTFRAGDGTASNPSIGFSTDGSTDTGLFHPGDGILCVAIDAQEKVRVDGGGVRVDGFMKVKNVNGVLPNPPEAGMIVLDGTTFKGYNGTDWVTLG